MILEISSGFSCIVVSSPLNSLVFSWIIGLTFSVCCISLDDTFLYRRKACPLCQGLPYQGSWRANARLRGLQRCCRDVPPQGGQPVLDCAVQLGALDVQADAAQHTGVDLGRQVDFLPGDRLQLLAQLLGPDGQLYADKVRADQQALRSDYLRAERTRNLIPIVEVRKTRKGAAPHLPVEPLHPGRMVFPDFDVADAEPYIDWSFFFAAWGLKGRYPEILDHPEKGAEARKVFADAEALLARIRDERLLTLQAAVGIFPARAEGDDIWITDQKGRERRLAMLRNQTRGEENRSLADCIAPQGDWIGCFAVTAGIGLRELCEKFRAEGDDYGAIMAKLLADRLTEAFAEAVHTFVRRQMWGYETGEPLTPQQTVRGQYRGRRMAFGYPASPDHSLKREVFDLLSVEMTTGMKLTENYMIDPGEALCGLMFADADYFSVGTIDTKQLLDYARRRGMEVEEIKKLIPNNI